MGVLDFLKKKKEVGLPPQYTVESTAESRLPEDLERFRTRQAPEIPESEPYSPPEYTYGQQAEKPEMPVDKIDLILQKLETIDTRLKLIEERLRR